MNNHAMTRCKRSTRTLLLCAIICLVVGCESEARTGPTSRPGDALAKDPFNYKPDIPSISGGGVGDFDKKGFKKDFDDFLNP